MLTQKSVNHELRAEDVRIGHAKLLADGKFPKLDGYYHCYASASDIRLLRAETDQEAWLSTPADCKPFLDDAGLFGGFRFLTNDDLYPTHVYFLGEEDAGYFFDTSSGAFGMRHNSYIPEARDPRWAEYYQLIDNGRL